MQFFLSFSDGISFLSVQPFFFSILRLCVFSEYSVSYIPYILICSIFIILKSKVFSHLHCVFSLTCGLFNSFLNLNVRNF